MNGVTQSQSQSLTLTVSEAAKYFGRTEQTIRMWCANGTLIAAKCRVIREKPGCWLIEIPQS